MTSLHHQNVTECEKCEAIFNTFSGFDSDLQAWFKNFRARHPEFHVSCAGRGREDQEKMVAQKLSLAHYGESAHNWNCAIDIFIDEPGLDLYDVEHFDEVLGPEIPLWLNWYGTKGHAFHELPHIEKSDWREMRAAGTLTLVE